MKRLIGVILAFFLIVMQVAPACASREGNIGKVFKPKGWYVQKDNSQIQNQGVLDQGKTGQDKKTAQDQIKERNRIIQENDRMLLRLKTEINKQNQLVNNKLYRLKRGSSVPTDTEAVKRALAALKEDRQALNQALLALGNSKSALKYNRQASTTEIINAQDHHLAVQQRCINLMQVVLSDLQQIQRSL